MLAGHFQRGFSEQRLATTHEPKVRRDDNGFYIMSLSENSKVYFDDYYRFLEYAYEKAAAERDILNSKLAGTRASCSETLSYYRARGVIVDLLMRTIVRFYTDGSSLALIMTPWCFGTVMLEKIEAYRGRISRGEVQDPNIPEYPFYVIQYLDEIYKYTLLELFDFPENAFQMRWQYSELLKKYSRILSDITGSLKSVLSTIKNYGS